MRPASARGRPGVIAAATEPGTGRGLGDSAVERHRAVGALGLASSGKEMGFIMRIWLLTWPAGLTGIRGNRQGDVIR